MSHPMRTADYSELKPFQNAAAGHDGVLSDQSGELLVKPCTNDEIKFYEQTRTEHADFSEFMPTHLGSIQLSTPEQMQMLDNRADLKFDSEAELQRMRPAVHGTATQPAIVLENLEHGFKHPNVLDLKLGARLYADGTRAEKALRLDKVAAETTSGSLNFRIAGMKVWNGASLDVYDKLYGRQFTAETVREGFATFFVPLESSLGRTEATQLLRSIEGEVVRIRIALEQAESRMFSASVLVVYEGDAAACKKLVEGASASGDDAEQAQMAEKRRQGKETTDDDDHDDDSDDSLPEVVVHQVKLIDFAHATWTPGSGPDENVIIGLKNIEAQIHQLISSRFVEGRSV